MARRNTDEGVGDRDRGSVVDAEANARARLPYHRSTASTFAVSLVRDLLTGLWAASIMLLGGGQPQTASSAVPTAPQHIILVNLLSLRCIELVGRDACIWGGAEIRGRYRSRPWQWGCDRATDVELARHGGACTTAVGPKEVT